MRPLSCRCGQAVYFENHRCGACGRALAFDPESLAMIAEALPGDGLTFCINRDRDPHCNWLAPDGGPCLSCRMSRVIPALSRSGNRGRWRRLEAAKRRLVYDLLALGLPLDPDRLEFVFKEDRRTNPDVFEDHVATGHRDGVITINAAEADEVYREEMRQAMNEPVRTLLGHFRHESGHYFHDLLIDAELRESARALFGDESQDYDTAMRRYYDEGPPPGWRDRFISAYASAHPLEDWAECWAHYLHIRAALEAAATMGWRPETTHSHWRTRFVHLVLGLNELLHSLGLPDAYPFVIMPEIGRKLDFVDEAVNRFRSRLP